VKRFVMILAVVILALGVGAAFAEEMEVMGGGCPPVDPGCPALPNFDTLKVNWQVVPMSTIKITERELNLCVYIGCCEWLGKAKEIHYSAVATGSDLRKIVGAVQTALPTDVGLHVNLRRPDSVGTSQGWKELSTIPVDLVTGISKLCIGYGTGQVALSAGPNAVKGSGSVIMQLTILDQAI